MRERPLLLILLASGLAARPAAAGSISITIQPRAELTNGELTAHVKVTNSGDEAAQSVAAVLRFGDQQARSEARDSLGPNQSMDPSVSLHVGELGPGRWPYRVAVDYTDANQYPFQALHVGLLNIGNPAPAKMAVPEIKSAPFSSSGSLRLRVKNLSGAARKAQVTIAVPEGVEATEPVLEVPLAPWEEKTLAAPIVNRTALAGSRYPVFAFIQYDEDGGVHQTTIAQGMVEIQAAQSFFQTQRTGLWLAAAVVVVAWLGFLLWWAAARRTRRAVSRP